ncbi:MULTISPECIES: hypothetical protein [unclassified Saccharothrix]|uniref:hypothetical protein n=1 Tax=unclassified Saccharothrix TaxID=2593673 RepID=UPI00307F37C8
MSGPAWRTWDHKPAVPAPRGPEGLVWSETSSLDTAVALAVEYDDLVRRHADDHGELPDRYAVEAAEIAHRLHVLLGEESEHYRRLSLEHREGRRIR